MVYIQINISNDLNKELNIYRAKNDFSNKESAIVDILNKRLIKNER